MTKKKEKPNKNNTKSPLINAKKLKDFAKKNPDRFVGDKKLAVLAGVSQYTVRNNKTLNEYKTTLGYDTEHPYIKDYIAGANGLKEKRENQGRKLKAIHAFKREEYDPDDPLFKDPVGQASAKKIEESLELQRERKIKLKLENAQKRNELVPYALVRLWFTSFITSINQNLDPVPSRVARGNKVLQELVENEIETAKNRAYELALRDLEKLDFKELEDFRSLMGGD